MGWRMQAVGMGLAECCGCFPTREAGRVCRVLWGFVRSRFWHPSGARWFVGRFPEVCALLRPRAIIQDPSGVSGRTHPGWACGTGCRADGVSQCGDGIGGVLWLFPNTGSPTGCTPDGVPDNSRGWRAADTPGNRRKTPRTPTGVPEGSGWADAAVRVGGACLFDKDECGSDRE